MKHKQIFQWLALVGLVILFAACRNNDAQPTTTTEEAYPGAVVVPVAETQPQMPTDQSGEGAMAPTAEPPAPEAVAESPTPVPAEPEAAGGGEAQPAAGAITTQHTVQEREWLHQIARCYGASASEIVTANALPHPGWIMTGEVWNIPNVGSVDTPIGPPCLIYYTVKAGDTLLSISSAYSVPIEVLIFANYGCYGYNAHYDYVPGGPNYYGYGYLGGCYYTWYPTIYVGDLLVIPVTHENAGLR
ncbi:MAG TPA: LysM peptidoglycan-binding domain-containing protein [Chloroflexota bacterium]|nr:LysM peptidoglycan-binding domain-containing protein [Chloroflexota bacterium]